MTRVRFAPSPTGYLHIGGLRTALYCYLFARNTGGTFVLRIEDTDRARFVADAEEDITRSLDWCGLRPDEGPLQGGPFGPYRQSERVGLYRRHATELLREGHAYYAFDDVDSLQRLRKDGKSYDASTRQHLDNSLTQSEALVRRRVRAGEPHVLRLCVPEQEHVRFTDLIKGEVSIAASQIDDQVLVKSDGMPTYHMANVVDDHHMGITHVIRGDEWISSTPKHMLLYRALGWIPPRTAHLPLILSPGGGKLSKRSARRHGIPVNVREYRAAGFEPEAVVNFLALLGWNPGSEQEVFSLSELESTFTLDRVNTSPASLDLDRLKWFNAQHIRAMPPTMVWERARARRDSKDPDSDPAYIERVIELLRDRLQHTNELHTAYSYFFADPKVYDERGRKKRWKADSSELVMAYASTLEDLESFDSATLEQALHELAAEAQVGNGRIIHPVRLAASGTTAGPSLYAMLSVLGREACVRRLRHAAAVLS